MASKVLDINVLIGYWQQRRRGRSLEAITPREVVQWGSTLAALYDAGIVTPTYLEFLAGPTSAHEVSLGREYLAQFKLLDQRRVLVEDWRQAEQLAVRIPRSGRRRQLGDCLIRAISIRLRKDVFTLEVDFPR